jgi:thiosulfate/3-mercaptopyruvate sulfurtransferase
MPYNNSTTVVSTDWLGSQFAHPHIRVVDGSWYLPNSDRSARDEFAAGHIPGARFFDIDEIKDADNPLPHMLPNATRFSREVSALGIGNDDQVVVYDGSGLYSAARVWWMFRAFGHEDVAVLDGGLPKWRAERRPIKGGSPVIEPRNFNASFNPALVRSLEDMRANIEGGHEQVLDARAANRFAGTAPEIRPGVRAGHIPGSLNLPFDRLIDAKTGLLRDEAALKAAFEAVGVDLGRAVVTTCGSGVTASLLALGLTVLGHQQNAVYDGSWSEWGGRTDTPIAP